MELIEADGILPLKKPSIFNQIYLIKFKFYRSHKMFYIFESQWQENQDEYFLGDYVVIEADDALQALTYAEEIGIDMDCRYDDCDECPVKWQQYGNPVDKPVIQGKLIDHDYFILTGNKLVRVYYKNEIEVD